MPTPHLTIERLELQRIDWVVDHEANTLIIATHLDDQQAAVAEQEAFRILQSLPG